MYEPSSAGNGPELDSLSDYRYTYFTFTDGSLDALQDSWREPRVPRFRSGLGWTGETWFYLEGKEPGAPPVRREYRTKGRPRSDMPEPSVLRELRTDADATRECLVAVLGGMHFERAQPGAAQRLCPDIGPFAVVHAAWASQANPREALSKCKSRGEEGFTDRRIDTALAGAEKFEMVEGVLFLHGASMTPQQTRFSFGLPSLGHELVLVNFQELVGRT